MSALQICPSRTPLPTFVFIGGRDLCASQHSLQSWFSNYSFYQTPTAGFPHWTGIMPRFPSEMITRPERVNARRGAPRSGSGQRGSPSVHNGPPRWLWPESGMDLATIAASG